MKTKLLKRLRNNYSLIEYKKPNEKPYYVWKFRYKTLINVLSIVFLPITIMFLIASLLLTVDLFDGIYYTQSSYSEYTIDKTNKDDVFNDFRKNRIQKYVFENKKKRQIKRIKTTKVWY